MILDKRVFLLSWYPGSTSWHNVASQPADFHWLPASIDNPAPRSSCLRHLRFAPAARTVHVRQLNHCIRYFQMLPKTLYNELKFHQSVNITRLITTYNFWLQFLTRLLKKSHLFQSEMKSTAEFLAIFHGYVWFILSLRFSLKSNVHRRSVDHIQ